MIPAATRRYLTVPKRVATVWIMKQTCHLLALVSLIFLGEPALVPPAYGQGHAGHGQATGPPAAPSSVRISMEALHAAGGVPPGWQFSVPPGDAAAGRQAFVDFKCYACHAVKGETFPLPPGEAATAGPDLTGMGGRHPVGYLAESILNPNAVLVDGPGYIGGDGRSIMPAYPDMTLAQFINLVAYLQSQSGGDTGHARESAHEQVAGAYRVRLVYKKAEAGGHAHHSGPMPASPEKPRLLVFLTDAVSGHPIPYAPMTARIEIGGKSAQAITLAPSLGPDGFHYGADVALPEATTRITLSIGPNAMRLGPGAPEGLKRAQTVTFDWK
ncbi:MAG: hypothetical protein C5B48_09685 [Candidatus Rokuibacteriota bacterium]|nr:MAG: hypothetical protein C5B48_09685 [Candidatus Rokubacteria bacterium]